MKIPRLLLPVICALLFASIAAAQTKQPPLVISNEFGKMFPAAQNADWVDKTDHFTVFFSLAGKKCEAKFSTTGDWLSTEMPVSLDSLPRPLQDSLKVCGYSNWAASSAYVFRFAKEPTQYHVVMTKPDQGRKILFFSPEGKLLAAR